MPSGRLPAGRMTADAVPFVAVVAAGEQPDWRIERDGDTLTLHRPGAMPATVRQVTTRRTPMRTVVTGRDDAGRTLSIGVTFGACRLERSARRASYLATVAYGEVRLRGCFLMPPPGERPLVD